MYQSWHQGGVVYYVVNECSIGWHDITEDTTLHPMISYKVYIRTSCTCTFSTLLLSLSMATALNRSDDSLRIIDRGSEIRSWHLTWLQEQYKEILTILYIRNRKVKIGHTYPINVNLAISKVAASSSSGILNISNAWKYKKIHCDQSRYYTIYVLPRWATYMYIHNETAHI